ncbi:MAG: N4-gp56 family major capsid protein [Oscillospiraceae bacterium]|nr:N4-gp56 family major capsid protein [Oscillospiraceae bacterium]
MAGGMNLASRYLKQVDERFAQESQAMLALSKDYKFKGGKTFMVYSLPVVQMNDYTRSGDQRYGVPADLSRSVQNLEVSRDRSFTFIIDKGDKLQSEMVSDAGRALARQIREVVVPEFDTYVFKTLADSAVAAGNFSDDPLDKTNAYAAFLAGMEKLGDNSVPCKGRVAFCSYRFANLLKQDAAFVKYGDASQDMLARGVIGEVDGCRIVKVPSNHLPAGTAFIITHAVAAAAPQQLEEYKIHDNPPGISGYLVEGRFIYDCFVLNEKINAVYVHGGQAGMKSLSLMTSASASGKTLLFVNGAKEGVKRVYAIAATADALPAAIYGTAVTLSAWTELTADSTELTPASGMKFLRVAELDAANKPIAVGTTVLNIG